MALEIAMLKGKALWRCERAANMSMFQFGPKRTVPGAHGREKEVGELVLCPINKWQ